MTCFSLDIHCVKSVQIRSFFWSVFSAISPNIGKYGPKKTPYLDIFHAVIALLYHLRFITYFKVTRKRGDSLKFKKLNKNFSRSVTERALKRFYVRNERWDSF